MSVKNASQTVFTFSGLDLYGQLCGVGDSKIRTLESSLGVKILPRGNTFILSGEQDAINQAVLFFQNLEKKFINEPGIIDFDFRNIKPPNGFLKTSMDDREKGNDHWSPGTKIFTTFKGKILYPKSRNQELYIKSILEKDITFSVGPAGTGKTFLAVASACRLLANSEVERLVLTRPAVEAGESLGFLPGDLAQKVDPYLRPIYDSLYECIGYDKTQEWIGNGRIEIAPLAFMRGRTLNQSFILLDEAQNCTLAQLKMFLTRLGKHSKMCLSGDITQIDLQRNNSGYEKAISLCSGLKETGTVIFTPEDVSRHPLVEKIVRTFEKDEKTI